MRHRDHLRCPQCDEAWPVCGQCKAKNRMCPARPALKVLDDGLKILRRHGATANLPGDSYAGSNLSLLDTSQLASLPGYKSHNSRHSRMHDSVPLSPSEQLCLTFIDSLQLNNFSYSLRVLEEFVWEVPRYLGNSKALDGAITCVLASQKQLLLNGDDGLTINAQLYNRALLSLRTALAGPHSCCSSDTLAATVMMHRIEVSISTPYPRPGATAQSLNNVSVSETLTGPIRYSAQLEYQSPCCRVSCSTSEEGSSGSRR